MNEPVFLEWFFPVLMVSISIYAIVRRERLVSKMLESSTKTARERSKWPGPLKGRAIGARTARIYLWAGVGGAMAAAVASILASLLTN